MRRVFQRCSNSRFIGHTLSPAKMSCQVVGLHPYTSHWFLLLPHYKDVPSMPSSLQSLDETLHTLTCVLARHVYALGLSSLPLERVGERRLVRRASPSAPAWMLVLSVASQIVKSQSPKMEALGLPGSLLPLWSLSPPLPVLQPSAPTSPS
ncbi:uncharacterized protein LOC126989131 [Eriocheir sinensis]|uniref:uncharacterized protein LOC126989131 n=1 Tax=Eriocheir sinensis TaxID=95602 RepID=UPI0021CAC792|nr:uncharacterized protein LOC126989131 [Eriocheir sinensis]XP_050703659.1 uncharacterized protein LOC126989131 [Eriocheir sinensis]XP_050703660.1 uncharacterized protein LOC126989131 [Eriocheir sinensis]